MKDKFKKDKFPPTGKSGKNDFASANSFLRRYISLPSILKNVFILLTTFFYFSVNAQTAPASNMHGPLNAYVSGADILITSEVKTSETPTNSYSFENNTSGASIVSQGPLQYDASLGIFKQTVEVNPGAERGSFTLILNAATSGGACESSASLTVLDPVK